MELYYCARQGSGVLIGTVNADQARILTIGDRSRSTDVSDYLDILGKKNEVDPLPKEYESLCRIVGVPSSDKLLVIPKDRLESHFRIVLEQLQKLLTDSSNSFYLETYSAIRKFLWSLKSAVIDNKHLEELILRSDNLTVKSTLRSFVPSTDESLTETIRYSMSSTSTGRLVVNTGPKILTAPSSARSCLKSRYPAGKILQIDIVSAEPKFALHQAGIDPPRDVYNYISNSVLEASVTRKNAKLVTLCALYGQSIKKLSKQLPESIGARAVVRKTKDFFRYDILLAELRKNFLAGNFRNAVGRPLVVDSDSPHLLISHYLQSSVAEGSLLMFADFMKSCEDKCVPIFVIHDALVIDAKKEFAEELLKTSEVDLYLGDWKFEASVTQITDI